MIKSDIDIDVSQRDKLLKLIKHIPSRLEVNERVQKHNSGIHVNPVPYDPINQCAGIDYKEAEERGYVKIDLLHMTVYDQIKTLMDLDKLLEKQPPWEKLWHDPEWTRQLVHVGNYTDLLQKMRPDSIPRMAAFISIIRPGKAHLQNKPWAEVFESVWNGDDSRGYTFKKSHAISYAVLVALHMNLINTPYQGN